MGAAATASAQELTLTITGDCPGRVTGEVTGATPFGEVAILYSRKTGNFVLPNSFPCAGTELGLGRPVLYEIEHANADGYMHEDEHLQGGACGLFVQCVDLETCTLSNVAQIGG
ncbi:MAG: hypothetical protein D8M59_00950 [Planctomycetes bacterium]|nr:hypothetical protein [Planctomycetota bacterium]